MTHGDSLPQRRRLRFALAFAVVVFDQLLLTAMRRLTLTLSCRRRCGPAVVLPNYTLVNFVVLQRNLRLWRDLTAALRSVATANFAYTCFAVERLRFDFVLERRRRSLSLLRRPFHRRCR